MNPNEAATLKFPLPREYFARTNFYRAATFATQRQVNARFLLPPGFYIVVPCTYEPGVEEDFLLTIYSEKPLEIEYVGSTRTTQCLRTRFVLCISVPLYSTRCLVFHVVVVVVVVGVRVCVALRERVRVEIPSIPCSMYTMKLDNPIFPLTFPSLADKRLQRSHLVPAAAAAASDLMMSNRYSSTVIYSHTVYTVLIEFLDIRVELF